jgi:hypothetical protein
MIQKIIIKKRDKINTMKKEIPLRKSLKGFFYEQKYVDSNMIYGENFLS